MFKKTAEPSSNYCSFFNISLAFMSLRFSEINDSMWFIFGAPPADHPCCSWSQPCHFFAINEGLSKHQNLRKFQWFFPHRRIIPHSRSTPRISEHPNFRRRLEKKFKPSEKVTSTRPFFCSLVEVTSLNDWKVFSSVTYGISGQLATQFSTWCEYMWMQDANKKYISYWCLRSATDFFFKTLWTKGGID